MKINEKYDYEIEVAKKEGRNIIAAICNNEVKPLNFEIDEMDKVELLDVTKKEGRRVYQRGLMYIMSMAFHRVYPDAFISIEFQLQNSMYCTLDNMEVTDEIIENVNQEMLRIIEQDLPIKKVIMTKEEAKKFNEKEKSLRGIAQLDNRQKEDVSLYFCEEYYNYFYGVMPISTGYIDIYELMKYREGFLIRYPAVGEPKSLPPLVETKKLLATLQEYEEIYRLLDVNTIYKYNNMIRNGKAKDLILLSESLQEKKISQIADMIVKKPGVKMVLIAGPSSSGKTTFSKRLGIALRINGLKPVMISVDDYFVERPETPRDEEGKYDFEALEAIDLKLFNEHLDALLEGKSVDMPTFDFKTGTKVFNGNYVSLAEDEILVVEGIHCLNDKLTATVPLDKKFKIYVSDLTVLNIDYYNRISTTDTRLIRRIVRDHKFRGYSAIHTLAAWQSVNNGEAKNIFPYQENCDIMFNSSLIYEISVLKQYALPLLDKIKNDCPEYAAAKRLISFLKYFEYVPTEDIPKNSLLREFIGDSIFDY